jgi:hypothetical protein
MAQLFVSMAFFFHLAFLFAAIKFVLFNFKQVDISYPLGQGFNGRKVVILLIFGFIFVLVRRYFNNDKIIAITDYYENSGGIYNLVNFIKFFSIYLIPLLLSIYLVNHSLVV